MLRSAPVGLLWLILALATAVLVGCNGYPPPPSGPPKVTQPGDLVWGYRHRGEARFSLLKVVEGVAYFGSDYGQLFAVDFHSSRVVWRQQIGGRAYSSAVVGGVVYIGSADGFVYALSADSGELHWRFQTGGAVNNTPAVVDGIVYAGSTNSHLYALDAATGEFKWRFNTNDQIYSSPAVANGVVFIGSNDDRGLRFGRRDGHIHLAI